MAQLPMKISFNHDIMSIIIPFDHIQHSFDTYAIKGRMAVDTATLDNMANVIKTHDEKALINFGAAEARK